MIISMVIAFFTIKKGGRSVTKFFLFMVLFQNIICIYFSPYISKSLYAVFTIEKELMLYIYFILFLSKNNITINKYAKYEIITIAVFSIICLKNLFFSPAGVTASVLALRYMLLPIIFVLIGKVINNNDKYTVFKSIISVSVIIATFGLLERFVLGDSFWTSINYGVYAEYLKGNRPDAFYNGVTVNFYTWDYFGVALRRIVSIVADPLTSAYLMLLGCLLLVNKALNTKEKKLILFFIATGLYGITILCFSKAVYVLSLVLIICYFYFLVVLPKPIIRLFAICSCVVAIAAIVIYLINAGRPTSIMNHLLGVAKGFISSSMFGNGLGIAGSSVQMFSGEYLSLIRESYIGSILAQLGICGLVFFTMFFIIQLKEAINHYQSTKKTIFILNVGIIIGLYICMFFSDSAVSVSGTGVYYLVIGMINNTNIMVNK